MTSIYKTFGTDKKLESDGITVEYDDLRFVVARAGGGNARFRKVFQKKAKPYRYKIDNDLLSEDIAQKLLAEAYAETIILRCDTKGPDGKWQEGKLPLKDGTIAEATPERLTQLFLDLPVLFSDVQSMANNVSNFRKVEEEEDEKNSVPS